MVALPSHNIYFARDLWVLSETNHAKIKRLNKIYKGKKEMPTSKVRSLIRTSPLGVASGVCSNLQHSQTLFLVTNHAQSSENSFGLNNFSEVKVKILKWFYAANIMYRNALRIVTHTWWCGLRWWSVRCPGPVWFFLHLMILCPDGRPWYARISQSSDLSGPSWAQWYAWWTCREGETDLYQKTTYTALGSESMKSRDGRVEWRHGKTGVMSVMWSLAGEAFELNVTNSME